MFAHVSSFSTSYPVKKRRVLPAGEALHAKFLDEIGTRWDASRNTAALLTLHQLKKVLDNSNVRICAVIGNGTHGVVYKATQKNAEDVALKVSRRFPVAISNSRKPSYKLDAYANQYSKHFGPIPASTFEDPNAITPHEMLYFNCEEGGMVHPSQSEEGDCLIMSTMIFFNGLNLSSQLKNGMRFSDRQILTITHIVAQTLGNAHAQGLIHQDVKPENIVSNGEEVRLIDWDNAAKIPAKDRVKHCYSRVGTPNYIAPDVELRKKMRDCGETDVYSLGWSCFEILHPEKHRELGFKIFDEEAAKAKAAGKPRPTWHEVAAPRALQYIRENNDPVYIEVLLEGMWAPQGMRNTAMQVARYTQDLISRLGY